eukprot:s1580_g1.t2
MLSCCTAKTSTPEKSRKTMETDPDSSARSFAQELLTSNFWESRREKRPLYLDGAAKGLLANAGMDEVIEALCKGTRSHLCSTAAHRRGEPHMRENVFMAYLDQATLSLTGAEHYLPWLLAVCKALEAAFGFVSARLLVDPEDGRLVASESDVLMFQLLGNRRLTVMRPLQGLPVSAPRPKALLEATLGAGDVLYLSCLGLEDPNMKQILSATKFVSLGSFCGVAQALQSLGLRGAAGPFDWMRSRCEGVAQLLATNFKDEGILSQDHRLPDHGAPFHPSLRQPCVAYGLGGQLLASRHQGQAGAPDHGKKEGTLPRHENIVFIRSVNCTDELRQIPNLIQALKARFPGSHVRLLVLVDYQDRALWHDYLNESLVHELGKDVVFSMVPGRVWEVPLPMPEWDPSFMRMRMELVANAYAVSIAKAPAGLEGRPCPGPESVPPNVYILLTLQSAELSVGFSLCRYLGDLLLQKEHLSAEADAFFRSAMTRRTRDDLAKPELDESVQRHARELLSKVTVTDLRKHFESRIQQMRQEQLESAGEVRSLPPLEPMVLSRSLLRLAQGVRCKCDVGESRALFTRGADTMTLNIAVTASAMLARLSDGKTHHVDSLPCDDPVERVCVCNVLMRKGCLELAEGFKPPKRATDLSLKAWPLVCLQKGVMISQSGARKVLRRRCCETNRQVSYVCSAELERFRHSFQQEAEQCLSRLKEAMTSTGLGPICQQFLEARKTDSEELHKLRSHIEELFRLNAQLRQQTLDLLSAKELERLHGNICNTCELMNRLLDKMQKERSSDLKSLANDTAVVASKIFVEMMHNEWSTLKETWHLWRHEESQRFLSFKEHLELLETRVTKNSQAR